MTTAFIAESMRARGYRVIEGAAASITGGAADSRLTRPGDLFAAFRGERLDGNDFVDEALARGAPAAVCERTPKGHWPDRTLAVVGDTRAAMAELSGDWLRTCGVRVVGITGTVGKTTAKELTAAALGARFRTHHSPGNLNSREGLPLALMSLTRDHEVSVLEMAMDSEGEIAELCAIAEPSVGAVLNIGATHLEKLGSMEAIEREKLSLARALPRDGVAVLNVDDERIGPVVEELACEVIGFGESDAARLRRGEVHDLGLEGFAFRASYEDKDAEVRLRLPGTHLAQGVLAAIGIQLALGVGLGEAAEAVSNARIDGRLNVRRSAGGARILDDTYNASPASVAGALALLRGLGGRRIALLGEMAELGEQSEGEHSRLGGVAAGCCDVLVAAGEACRALVEAARAGGLDESHWFETKEEAAAFAAGSRRGRRPHSREGFAGAGVRGAHPGAGGRGMIRALLSGGISFALTVGLGWPMVQYLRAQRAGKAISEDQPASHQEKAGTPTFGGLIIWVPTLIVTAIAIDWLDHRSILLPLGMIAATGAIGFIDDLGTLQERVGFRGGLTWRVKIGCSRCSRSGRPGCSTESSMSSR